MFIVKLYTIQLIVFSGFLNYTYAMVERSEKQPTTRTDRQFRPVVNSIIFLIAANLVAKGALGLGAYQTPTLPSNIQGSLFLTLNAPNTPQQVAQQYLPLWFPVQNQLSPSSTQPPRPIAQTQIVQIGEPVYEDEFEAAKDGLYTNKLLINRYNSIEDPLESSSSEEVEVKAKPEDVTTEVNTEETTTIDNDVEILPQNFTNTNEELQEVARQINQQNNTTPPTTTATTTTTTPRPTTTNIPAITEGASPIIGQSPPNATNMTGEGNYTQYGPPGYYNFGYQYGPPVLPNITNNNTQQNNTYYGPYTGNENISIAYEYGPPVYQKPVYQKPFFSSPEDPYLNNYNQYYNNFYDSSPSYYSSMYKYNDIFKNFYNNYPSFYNNYLGK